MTHTFAIAASSGFLSSDAAVLIISVICGVLIGLAVMALTAQRGDVGSRIGSFVAPSGQAKMPSLIESALGNRRDTEIERSPRLMKVALELEVAGINITVQSLLVLTLLGTVSVAWFLYSAIKSPLAILLALLVPFGVKFGIGFAANRKRRAFDEQLPDNLQVIGSAMRAGQTFVGALATVTEDAPDPSRRELSRAVTDERLGIPLPEALSRVTARMNSEDFHHVSIVATLQRETGGNTAEVIDLVTETIRERLELRRMVRSLTAQGRLAGMMLSLLPVGILLAISAIDPTYVRPLFHKTIGIIALVISGVMILLGGLAIRKIITIKV